MSQRTWFDARAGAVFRDWQQAARELNQRIADLGRRAATDIAAVRAYLEADGQIPGPLLGFSLRQQDLVASRLSPPGVVDFRRGLRVVLKLDQDLTKLSILPPDLALRSGVHCTLFLMQDATGGRNVAAWSDNIEFIDDEAPDLTEGTAGQVYGIGFYADGTNGVMRVMHNGWWAR